MKLISYILKIILILLVNTSALAKNFNNSKSFLGVEIAKQYPTIATTLKHDDYMQNDLPKKTVYLYSIFTGVKFSENFGVEIGYEKQNIVKFSDYDQLDDSYCENIIKASHPYFGITYENNIKRKIKWQLLLGISASKIKYSTIATDASSNSLRHTFNASRSKLTPVLRASIIQNITDKISIRASLKYMVGFNLPYYTQEADSDIISKGGIIKFKKNYSIGFGVVYSL